MLKLKILCFDESCNCPECLDDLAHVATGCRYSTPLDCTPERHPDCFLELDGYGCKRCVARQRVVTGS